MITIAAGSRPDIQNIHNNPDGHYFLEEIEDIIRLKSHHGTNEENRRISRLTIKAIYKYYKNQP